MATNIPPHNLNEVVDACLALLSPEMSIDEPIDHHSGADLKRWDHLRRDRCARRLPDRARARGHARQNALRTTGSRGSNDRQAIIVELPYQVVTNVPCSKNQRTRRATSGSTGFPTCATSPISPACAWSSSSSAASHARVVLNCLYKADAVAGYLRHEHGGAGRRPAALAQPQADARLLPLRIGARSLPGARCSSCARRASGTRIQEGLAVALSTTSTPSSR